VSDAKRVLDELLAARIDRSADRARLLLSNDVRYWDCERGEIAGRDAVAAALTADDVSLDLETAAGAGDDAVLELQVQHAGRRYRATEVYRLAEGAIASIRVYFDPALRA
jgi:hypothetical protein